MPFIAIALIVAAALGGGTSLAAQQALPGDALWGFKVQVNERIAETVAVGEKSKADWDITFAQTRLEEAQKLAVEGRLDAEAQADIEGNFDAHARAVAARIAALQLKGEYAAAADVAARYQAAVAARIPGLTNAKAHASTNANANAQATLGGLINKVQAALDDANEISADASAQASTHPESEGKENDEERGSATSSSKTEVRVQTGTSVQGGQGGIKVDNDTGVETAI